MTKEALKLALEALEEAADAIDSWGSYASGYFQVKHDLENDISKARNAITTIKEALAQSEPEPTFTYDQVKAHIQAAMLSEREACAKIADENAAYWAGYKIANAIRARGQA